MPELQRTLARDSAGLSGLEPKAAAAAEEPDSFSKTATQTATLVQTPPSQVINQQQCCGRSRLPPGREAGLPEDLASYLDVSDPEPSD